MFILQEMNNYETTRSDEFGVFDREIMQNTTRSCFTKSKKIYGSKTCNWSNSRDVSLFRSIVYIKRISNFLIFAARKWTETLNRSNWNVFQGSVTLSTFLVGRNRSTWRKPTIWYVLFWAFLSSSVAYNEATWKSRKTSFRISRKLFQTSKHHEKND